MSEGELKKRILETLGDQFYNNPSVNWAAQVSAELLDEAKKDFDKTLSGVEVPSQLVVWFKKWFGESP
jgi:hypothetical protein